MQSRSAFFGLVSILSAHAVSGQRYYLQVHGTYQWPIGGLAGAVSNDVTPDGQTQRVIHYERVNLNWGRGAGGGITIGRKFTPLISGEVRATWFPRTRTDWHSEAGNEVFKQSVEMQFLRLEPGVRFSTSDTASAWYVVLGPSMALLPLSRNSSGQVNTFFGQSFRYSSVGELSGGVGWGGFAAFGYHFRVRSRICFFAELNITAQSWSPNRGELTEYIVANEDRLSSMTDSERLTDFVDEYDSDENRDAGSPTKQLRFHYPMSSWGLRAGIQVNLGRSN